METLNNPSLFRRRLITWFKKQGRVLPWRKTRDPYAILISEVMLQQTQVATVIDYFERWLKRFPDFKTLAAAPEADVLHAWQGLGYYSRARNLHRTAKIVMEKHNGIFPEELDAIRALPGIGRYTAGAVAAFAFGQPTPIVDANIARVLARLYDLRRPVDTAAGAAALWSLAENLQPAGDARNFNEALMELGALVCLPRRPGCGACPVRAFCRVKNPEVLPVKKPRQKAIRVEESCAFILAKGKLLLEQETGRKWRGLWTMPGVEKREMADGKWQSGSSESEIRKRDLLIQLEYPFTHHRVTLSVFSQAAPKRAGAGQRWFSLDALPAMPNPHRRAVEKLTGRSPV